MVKCFTCYILIPHFCYLCIVRMPSTKKTVVFAETNTTRVYSKSVRDMVTDINIVTDSLVNFLGRTVQDVLHTVGKHFRTRERRSPQSPVNLQYVNTKLTQSLHRLLHPMQPSERSVQQIAEYFQQRLSWQVKDVFVEAIHKNSNTASFAATLLIMLGLESFLKYNHCMNECYNALEYSDTEDTIRIKSVGKRHPRLKDACLESHTRIEDAIGIDDIRAFDIFLRKASMNHCSILKAPPSKRHM